MLQSSSSGFFRTDAEDSLPVMSSIDAPMAPLSCETGSVSSPSADEQGVKSVAFYALGCRANQLEASALADEFRAHGWQVQGFADPVSLYVINTCTVTHGGDSDSRHIIRKARRQNPQARIAVTGCYAQVSPQEVAALEGVHYVIGNNFKQDILQIVTETPVGQTPWVQVSEIDKSRIMLGATSSALNRTRASLKIQDGCDYKCSYCIIPEARGLSRSVPRATLISQVKQLLEQGFKEIVLTGINIGQYEEPMDQSDLTALLTTLTSIPGEFRLRLSSLDPFEVTQDLLALMAESPKLCPYLHLSTQSLEDTVLKRMGRRHRVADVADVCQTITQYLPHAAIGMDIIVGFPGETAQQFETTMDHVRTLPISYVHTFSYSQRANTAAATFEGQVSEGDKKQRSTALMALAQQKNLAFRQQFVGTQRPVLIESGGRRGLSDNYIHVDLNEASARSGISPNSLIPVTITDVSVATTQGVPVLG